MHIYHVTSSGCLTRAAYPRMGLPYWFFLTFHLIGYLCSIQSWLGLQWMRYHYARMAVHHPTPYEWTTTESVAWSCGIVPLPGLNNSYGRSISCALAHLTPNTNADMEIIFNSMWYLSLSSTEHLLTLKKLSITVLLKQCLIVVTGLTSSEPKKSFQRLSTAFTSGVLVSFHL